MGREISWSLSNFSAGIHQSPRKTERPEVYAKDVKNLRYTPEGALTARYGSRIIWNVTDSLTGLAIVERQDDEIILYLTSTDKLGIIKGGYISGTPTVLVTDALFSGKLSAALITNDVIFVTSEGVDQGYWIDLSNYPTTAAAYPIGLAQLSVAQNAGVDIGATGNLDHTSRYYYVITGYRDVPPLETKENLISNIIRILTNASASNDREIQLTSLPVPASTTGITKKRLYRTEGRGTPSPIGTATGGSNTTLINTAVNFEVQIGTGGLGRIVINTTDRSQGTITDIVGSTVIMKEGLSGGFDNLFQVGDSYEVLPTLSNLEFRQLDTIATGATTYNDTLSDTSLTANHPLLDVAMATALQLPPAEMNIIEVYNDRVFLAGSNMVGIRYSLVNAGTPIYWAFPAVNEIFAPKGQIQMCAAYRGVLVLGGPSVLGRLTGASEVDFDLDFTDLKTGPIDSYSWGIVRGVFVYVGTDGIYQFDGVNATRIDAPVREYFENPIPIISASVVGLPTNEILIDIYRYLSPTSTDHIILVMDENGWRRLANLGTGAQWGTFNTLGIGIVLYTSTSFYIKRYFHGNEHNFGNKIPVDDETSPSSFFPIPILFRSQTLAWEALGFRDKVKFFRWLEILRKQTGGITVDIWVDGVSVVSASYTVAGNAVHPFRVPIRRRGKTIQFEIARSTTTTEMEIQSLRIEGEIL